MDTALTFILYMLVIGVVIILFYVVQHWFIYSKHICGLCMGKGVVSTCCGSDIEYMSESKKPRIKHTVCNECGSVCKTERCSHKRYL